jgi:hypothetical protein
LSFQRRSPEANAAKPETANEASRPSADLAAIADPVWIFSVQFAIDY